MNKELSNKNFLIVGANGSLAKETIKHMLNDGVTNIVMACRTEAKGQVAKKEIMHDLNLAHKVNLSVVGGFDMTDPSKISAAVANLSENTQFDVVFLAAGFAVFSDDYEAVNYGGKRVEKNVFQNLIGSHFTLVELKKKGLMAKGARVVLAGGEGARGIKGMIEKPVFGSASELRDYIFLKDVPKYNVMNAIGVSKFFGALWTRKLSKIEDGNMEVIWFSPGLTSKSSGLRSLSLGQRIMMGAMFSVMNLLGKSQGPVEGGRKNADCLTGKIGENGDLLGAPEGKSIGKITDQITLNKGFSNDKLINELWDILEEVVGEY